MGAALSCLPLPVRVLIPGRTNGFRLVRSVERKYGRAASRGKMVLHIGCPDETHSRSRHSVDYLKGARPGAESGG